MTGFLALEPLLLERLSALQLDGVRVLSAADLSDMRVAGQLVPAVYVIPDGWRITHERGLATVVEKWLTVLVTRNIRPGSALSGADARAEAGPLLDTIFRAVLGFEHLLPVPAPKPAFEAGFAYFPLAWETMLTPLQILNS